MSSSTEQLKQNLRRALKEKLRKISASERVNASKLATERLIASEKWHLSQTVLLYASLDTELSTDSLIQTAWEQNKRVALIRISSPTNSNQNETIESIQALQFDLRLISNWDETEKGLWNVRQPSAQTSPISIDPIDLILTPGLAFDRQGNRLGRGASLYDRLLAQKKSHTLAIGFFYSFQEVEKIPTEPHDQKLEYVITEKECIPFL